MIKSHTSKLLYAHAYKVKPIVVAEVFFYFTLTITPSFQNKSF